MTDVRATWGRLRKGDAVLDKTGKCWVIQSDPVRVDTVELRFMLKDSDRKQVAVVRDEDEPVWVTQFRADRPIREELRGEYARVTEQTPDEVLDQATETLAENIQEMFGPDKVELLATETDSETEAREAATEDRPVVLPILESPFTLRAHLYLFHEFYVAGESNGLALKEHHRHEHASGKIPNPHVHEEAT